MKIVKLKSENVKRLQAVLIEPDATGMVLIGGKNGAGKSSVLDSIMYALGGGKAIPGEPVRKGQEKAEIKVKLRGDDGVDLIVTRTMKPDGATQLSITSADGAKYPSPQTILDTLYGSLTFDPVAFEKMKPVDQVATLKRLAGIDAEYDKLIRQRQGVFDQRADVNRQVKLLDGQIAGMPQTDDKLVAVDVAALLDERKEMDRQKLENAAIRSDVDRAKAVFDSSNERANALFDRVEKLQAELASAKNELQSANVIVLAKEKVWSDKQSIASKIIEPDYSKIDAALASAQAVNRKVDEQSRRTVVVNQRDKAAAQSKSFTNNIEALDLATRTLIEKAKLPIAGLAVTDAGVTFNAIPFDQCSSAERLRVSVAMGMAMHNKLRVMLIRDASLLDDDNMAMIRDLAKTEDYQLWIERVGDKDESAIIIEDGKQKV